MSDTKDSNKPAPVKARIAFNATIGILEELGCDPTFAGLIPHYLIGCEQLQKVIRDSQ